MISRFARVLAGSGDERRHPAVAVLPGETQHPRSVGREPQLGHAGLALQRQPHAAVAVGVGALVEQLAQQRQGRLEVADGRVEAVAERQQVLGLARADAEDEAALAEMVQAERRTHEVGRRPSKLIGS
jgi:hypothetical protein